MLSLLVPAVASAPSLDPRVSVASSWPTTAAITLRWNVAQAQPATDSTSVRAATDGRFLYVRFDADQSEPIIAAQHSDDTVPGVSNANGVIAWGDDAVWVDLWPTGPGGFQYQFEANPNGSHNEASSENAAFAPRWESHGAKSDGGYTVTMALPLSVVHGAHVGSWRMQFCRYVRSTGALDVWSYDPAQTTPDDAKRAGDVTVPVVSLPSLPKPRIGIYGLGAAAAKSAGTPASSFGADFSVPVSQTAALFGTIHPDYSNVELDQQSISPTVSQRTFSEVRPFFTQAADYYNTITCKVCYGQPFATLYTFGIPTPLAGYAFEGKEGDLGLAAYDAIGYGRNDSATAFDYTSQDAHWNAEFQHVGTVDQLVDHTDDVGLGWSSGRYLTASAHYATESGTNVTDRGENSWFDADATWADQSFLFQAAARTIGDEFNPVDGFIPHVGIAGYGIYSARIWTFVPQDLLSTAGVGIYGDRYQSVADGQNQSDNYLALDFLTRSALDVQFFTGSDYWRFYSTNGANMTTSTLEPISQSAGFLVTYHSGMQTSTLNFGSHGSSATPTEVQWYTGRYGLGRLDTWLRTSTLRVGDRGDLTLTDDDTAQWMSPGLSDNIQWLEGIAYSYQVGAQSSFALGARRVIGDPPVPNGGGNCIGECTNLSVAYHLRLRDTEFYVAYGDPSTLVTKPQALLKITYYIGGQKGT